jgi:hypothetical protein
VRMSFKTYWVALANRHSTGEEEEANSMIPDESDFGGSDLLSDESSAEGHGVPDIKNVESAIEVLGTWNPYNFAKIHSLQWEPSEELYDSDLVVKFTGTNRELLRTRPSEPEQRFGVEIRFIGIHEVTIGGETCRELWLNSFEIEDISDRGWEKLHFRVGETEMDGFFSLYCNSIEIVDVYLLPNRA